MKEIKAWMYFPKKLVEGATQLINEHGDETFYIYSNGLVKGFVNGVAVIIVGCGVCKLVKIIKSKTKAKITKKKES